MKNCTYVRRATLVCLLLIAVAGIIPAFGQQIEKGMTVSNGDYLGFLEYKPVGYEKEGNIKHPLIIFLHGIGERGNGTTDLKYVARVGLPWVIREGHNMTFTWNNKKETFLVLSPQCPSKYGMWPQLFVEELIKYAKQNLRIDPDRIYLTGLSMGGGGSLRYISTSAQYPKNISAAATICSPCTFDRGDYVAAAKLPLWAFHAADDPAAPASCTDRAINRLNAENPEVKPIRTMWPTGGHHIWDRVYTDTVYKYDNVINIYEWFLGQNRTLPVNKLPVARAGGVINTTTGSGTVTLNAAASTDADGKIVRYVWKKILGPNSGRITQHFGTNASTTLTGLTLEGTYKYELAVVDNRAGFTRDTVTVNVTKGGAPANIAPVAKAGNDVTITLPINKTNLSGNGSTDQDGTIQTYLWTKTSGPAQFNVASPNSSVTEFSNLQEGTYTLKLKVTDNKGASAEDAITVIVKPAPVIPNVAPVAKAGNDVTITLPTNKTNLSGNGSTDQDGTIQTYLWTKTSGPVKFNIASPNSSVTEFSNLQEGTYTLKLKVTDNKGASAEDAVTVIVKPAPVIPNVAPVAKAGNDVTITLPTNKTNLNGSSSTDQDGTIQTYLWTTTSGPAQFNIASPNSSVTEFSNLQEGTYTLKLKVTDNKGASAEDAITVIVKPAPVIPNVAPVAKAGNDVTITLPTNKTNLNGSTSTDQDGTIQTYLWTKTSGPAQFNIESPNSSVTEFSNLQEGTYTLKLKVTDNKGASAEDAVTVIVKPAPVIPNVAPVAKAGNDITITLPINKTKLDGSASADADGTISKYLWTKISGPSQFIIASTNSAITDLTNLKEGTYIFRLRVTDNKGDTNDDNITVKVNPAPPPPNVAPIAQAGANKTITLPVNYLMVNGASSADPDGTIESYRWDFISGPAAYVISNADEATTAINGLEEGTYTFRLEVKDNDGAKDADTIVIKVNAAIIIPPPVNVAPVARIAGSDITITLPVNEVTLNGTSSSDEDGNITNYTWTKTSGPAAFNILSKNAAETVVNNLEEGVYYFSLQVKDNEGDLSTASIKITVNAAENVAPVARIAGSDITITLPVNEVTLNGTSSSDEDGNITNYTWTKTSGPAAFNILSKNAAETVVNNLEEGVYYFSLQVKDNEGDLSTASIKITVNAAENVAPVADAGVDMKVYLPNPAIRLDGLKSFDPDGNIVSYSWTKVSGAGGLTVTNSTTTTPGVYGVKEGVYVFKLTVVDNKGASSSDELTLTVLPAIEKIDSIPTDSIPTDSIPDDNLRYEEKMSVYPNPALSDISVKLISDPVGQARVSIYNVNGMLVYTQNSEKSTTQFQKNIHIGHLQRGVYYLQIFVDGKKSVTKFIKR